MMKTYTFMVIVVSTIMCVGSKSWWEYWIFLETNSLAFIIYMFTEKKKEKIFVFLIFQTIPSALMMMFIFSTSWSTNQNVSKTPFYLMAMSILMKIGMFPFHYWIMKIIKSLSWTLMILLFSWQKLIPLLILLKLLEKSKIFLNVIMLSIFMLNFIIIKLSNISVIMAVSSLMHNTWVFAPLLALKELSALYLLSYTLILTPLMISMYKMNMKNTPQQMPMKIIKKEMKFSMLSISGIPPFIGFFMKMAVLNSLLQSTKKTIYMTTLMMSSCVTFYVYLQMFIKHFLLEKLKSMKKNNFGKKNEIKEVSWIFITTPMLLWI